MTLLETAQTLARLLGREALEARPLGAESRNAVARVTLDGGERAILKFYDPATDPHAANRFRREEKVLTLLKAAAPPVAPRALGGFLPAQGPAMLLMQDAGAASLADALASGGANWDAAAAFLDRLHAEMDRRDGPLRATAMAVDLDRLTASTLARRFAIAVRRILDRDPDPDAVGALDDYLAPLLAAPAAMIHNSMSPLNIVTGPDGPRAIDWETLSHGSRLWDWAEMLRAPYRPRAMDESEAAVAERFPAHDTIDMYRRAVLSRHMDSLATVALRRRMYERDGRPERAAEYARRAAFYAGDLETILHRAAPPAPLGEAVRAVAHAARR